MKHFPLNSQNSQKQHCWYSLLFAGSLSCCLKWCTRSMFFTLPLFFTKNSRTESCVIASFADMAESRLQSGLFHHFYYKYRWIRIFVRIFRHHNLSGGMLGAREFLARSTRLLFPVRSLQGLGSRVGRLGGRELILFSWFTGKIFLNNCHSSTIKCWVACQRKPHSCKYLKAVNITRADARQIESTPLTVEPVYLQFYIPWLS